MQKKSILILEDDPLIAEDLKRKISRWGYEIFGVESEGYNAILNLSKKQNQPELILLNEQLSDSITGSSIANLFLNQSPFKMLFFTGMRPKDLSLIVSDESLIQKPFAPVQLKMAINNLIGA